MIRKITVAPIAFVLLGASPAIGADWSCSNREIAEIRCGDTECEIERDGYTPMEVSLAPTRIEVCAYSGCFSGPVLIRRTSAPHVLYHARVRVSGEVQPISIILDTEAQTALMRWADFANVMRCTRR
jgi:hypothetical protein